MVCYTSSSEGGEEVKEEVISYLALERCLEEGAHMGKTYEGKHPILQMRILGSNGVEKLTKSLDL